MRPSRQLCAPRLACRWTCSSKPAPGVTATKFDPNAKVLMCSAMGQQALVVEAIQAGAKDFVVKPFQAERVLEAVAKALA